MNELAGQILGGYLLEEEIGSGSMGIVYRGKQVNLGREVAVKVLRNSQDHSSRARFIREAQAIAGLNHANIVSIYDAGQQGSILYCIMEYIPGPTVAGLLRLDGRIPGHLAAEYLAQAAEALDVAYKEQSVIHGNIRPEKLLMGYRGALKVIGFGLSRTSDLQQGTRDRAMPSSIRYASPEYIRGGDPDHRSDIYALGVILYEIVTGQHPYSGAAVQDLAMKIPKGQVLPPAALVSDLPPGLEGIILQAIAANPDERFPQAGLLAAQLRALQLRLPLADQSHSLVPQSLPASIKATLASQDQGPRLLRLPTREPSGSGSRNFARTLETSPG